MAFIDWHQGFSVGIDELDAQHRQLLGMVNDLGEAMKDGKGRLIIADVLDRLLVYTRTHFAAEETLMFEHDYPDYEAHRGQHEQLTSQVEGYRSRYIDGEEFLASELLYFLKDWLNQHLAASDRRYTPFFHERGVR